MLDVQLPALQGDTLQLARDTKRNFTTLLDEFLVALRDSAQAESHVLSAMRTALISELPAEERQVKEPKESDALLLQAEQERRGDEMVFAQERWEMLSDIESSIHDVNSIFSDLAGLIAAQGTAVEHVETTTEDAAQFVDRSNRELHVSKFRQARNKNLFFTLLIIVASIIAVFLIILLN